MWLENLVELKRREGPPPPLPEKQEAFTRGFSFFNDIRPPHYLAKYRALGIPGTYSIAFMLPLFTFLSLTAWINRPVSEVISYARWIAIGLLVFMPIAMLYNIKKGYRLRRRRWEFWEWPDFTSFAMEEANAELWGTINFSAIFILYIGIVGMAVR
jgi:hypothetical protein